jgi:hypothetical protein
MASGSEELALAVEQYISVLTESGKYEDAAVHAFETQHVSKLL